MVFLLCITRLWLMVLPSSLWTDETVTAFAARYPAHPSLAIVPPYTQSIYYVLPRLMHSVFGFSEIAYRIPSVLAMGLALLFIARLAIRLIHPDAAWFAVFACLAIPGIDYFAVDAKPYALGTLCAAAAIFYLIRWFDTASSRDAALFLVAGALLWRIHEVYWPFYLVFAFYPAFRIWKRDSPVSFTQAVSVFAILALALLPVALYALRLLREAGAHVFIAPPQLLDLRRLLRRDWNFIAVCGGLAWLAARALRWRKRRTPNASDLVLVLAWWLLTPIVVFLFSRLSGTSLFAPRYLSLSLPGLALAATMAASLYLPAGAWRPASIAMAAASLVFAGNWTAVWPEHDPAGWGPAAQYANSILTAPNLPVLCTSPFIEAVPPVWRPDYPLPGFLYTQLFAYPLRGRTYLLPVRPGDEARRYVAELAAKTLPQSPRFLIYGGIPGAEYWRVWLAGRPELRGWRSDSRDFGDIRVVTFAR